MTDEEVFLLAVDRLRAAESQRLVDDVLLAVVQAGWKEQTRRWQRAAYGQIAATEWFKRTFPEPPTALVRPPERTNA